MRTMNNNIVVVMVIFLCAKSIAISHFGDLTELKGMTSLRFGDAVNYYEEDENVSCNDDKDCKANYTKGIDEALKLKSSLVRTPTCKRNVCSCLDYCLSKSYTFDDNPYYYCGPCGRVGSVCNGTCEQAIAICKQGFCKCQNGGSFYEIYFCYIPYYGYEVALQMAITTCVVIALCLLLASIYNAIGFRRLRRMQGIREMFGGESGTRESPSNDTPPKYDDIIEELPSYQDALQMSKQTEGCEPEGIVNLGFLNEETPINIKSIKTEVNESEDMDAASSGSNKLNNRKSINCTCYESPVRHKTDNIISEDAISEIFPINTYHTHDEPLKANETLSKKFSISMEENSKCDDLKPDLDDDRSNLNQFDC